MRAWMIAQAKPWTVTEMCDALGIPPGKERERMRNGMPEFIARAEVVRVGYAKKQIRRQIVYAYNRAYRRIQKGTRNQKIYKAMYVSGTWAVTDIHRLAGGERSYLDKLLTRLRRDGFVRPVGRRGCAHGAGAETIYHIPDRDRFRREVMG